MFLTFSLPIYKMLLFIWMVSISPPIIWTCSVLCRALWKYIILILIWLWYFSTGTLPILALFELQDESHPIYCRKLSSTPAFPNLLYVQFFIVLYAWTFQLAHGKAAIVISPYLWLTLPYLISVRSSTHCCVSFTVFGHVAVLGDFLERSKNYLMDSVLFFHLQVYW